MLEARLNEAGILKKLLDSIKELVTDANFECNDEGINLQAMDNSHVALVSVRLHADSFKRYRCDRPLPLGVNLGALTKVLKCAKDDDVCVLKAADEADVLSLTYESKSSDRIAEYDMKLMEIDSDTLGIPDTEYDARVTMPSTELARIVRDLSQLGESVRIEVSKDGVRFVSDGESANGSVLLKHTGRSGGSGSKTKKEESEDEEDVKKEQQDDVEMDEDGEEEKEADEDEDDEGQEKSKKRKKAQAKSSKPAKKSKRTTAEDEGGDEGGVNIEMNQHVNLTFSLKYLVNFSKSTALSKTVMLMMSNDVPLLVSYEFGQGFIRYYLAPKIGDD